MPVLFISFCSTDVLSESHHVTTRQATGSGRNNRVTDGTFSTPSQQELERSASPVSYYS